MNPRRSTEHGACHDFCRSALTTLLLLLVGACSTPAALPTGALTGAPTRAPEVNPPKAAPDTHAVAALGFSRPIVLLGEVHDNAAQHALRLQAFAAWLAQGARPALLMEQFDRSRQSAIDRLRAGPVEPDADALIDAGAPDRQGWDWSFYRPFVALALEAQLPIVAANVGRDEARAVIRDGLAANGFDPAVPADVLAAQTQAVLDSHCGLIAAPMAARMALAQVARDQFMARQVAASANRGVLLLAGNGHVRNDIGVPRWLPAAVRSRTEAIGVLEAGDAPAAGVESGADLASAFDRAVFTPTQTRPDPCESMRAPR